MSSSVSSVLQEWMSPSQADQQANGCKITTLSCTKALQECQNKMFFMGFANEYASQDIYMHTHIKGAVNGVLQSSLTKCCNGSNLRVILNRMVPKRM